MDTTITLEAVTDDSKHDKRVDSYFTAVDVALYLIVIIFELCAIERIKRESGFKWVMGLVWICIVISFSSCIDTTIQHMMLYKNIFDNNQILFASI